jgi:hypothetical protein
MALETLVAFGAKLRDSSGAVFPALPTKILLYIVYREEIERKKSKGIKDIYSFSSPSEVVLLNDQQKLCLLLRK